MNKKINKEQIKKGKLVKNKIQKNKKDLYNEPKKYLDKKKVTAVEKKEEIKKVTAKKAAMKNNPFIRDFPGKHDVYVVNDNLLENYNKPGRKVVVVAKKSKNVSIIRLVGRDREKPLKKERIELEDSSYKKLDNKVLDADKKVYSSTRLNNSISLGKLKKEDSTIIGFNDSKNIENLINTPNNKKEIKKMKRL